MASDRRAKKRYVIDGLMLEIGGIAHETIDVAANSVAVIRVPGVDYKNLQAPFRFKLRKSAAIDHPVSALRIIGERAAMIVFEYTVKKRDWEATLLRHDVRAGVHLEDVFGDA